MTDDLSFSNALLTDYLNTSEYPLDDFQIRSCSSLSAGQSVLVAAPTGSGKTVTAYFSVHLAMARGVKVFYTTPIKALSNKKYADLCNLYGQDSVGLLTGDMVINRDAPILVMTTEVLRNMVYGETTQLSSLGYVVLDEVHYLGDKSRGPVWEEVIIHLPEHVRLVCLSATVSNAREFGKWLNLIRGTTDVIVSHSRPVPLHHHVALGTDLYPLFHDPRPGKSKKSSHPAVNLELLAAIAPFRQTRKSAPHDNANVRGRSEFPGRYSSRQRRSRSAKRQKFRSPPRAEVLRSLAEGGFLPTISFIFSRAGCDDAVKQCLAAGLDVTSQSAKREIRLFLDDLYESFDSSDREILDFETFAQGVLHGFAAHHAGLIPQFKEVVEKLFLSGHLRIIFATETLALGVNMPAHSVFVEKLIKFNGESHELMTPAEFTQLTGRAGRRGIDTEGHAIIAWHPRTDLDDIAELAHARSYALLSQFTPTYNMTANLLARMTPEAAKDVLRSSFAQFQADSDIAHYESHARKLNDAAEGYATAMHCEYGDFIEYFLTRHRTSEDDPVMACPEFSTHMRYARRWRRTRRKLRAVQQKIADSTSSLAVHFDHVREVLEAFDFLGPNSSLLQKINGSRELLVARSIRSGLWGTLDEPEMAALASALVYHARGGDGVSRCPLDTPAMHHAEQTVNDMWADITTLEKSYQLPQTPQPDYGIAHLLYKWTEGHTLASALSDSDIAPGDFVRWAKQTVDLLEQVSLVAPAETYSVIRRVILAIRRGVVEE